MQSLEHIVRENEKRKIALYPEYDPLTGYGSPIPRFPITISPKEQLFIPVAAQHFFSKDAQEDLAWWCKKNGVPIEYMLAYIHNIRIPYDFEYYAAKTLTIKDKKTSKDITFKLNNPQRKVHEIVNEMLFNNIAVRIDILKARKWGGSTYVEMLFFWIQNVIKTGWNSCIVADVEDQARGIRSMYTKAAKGYPKELGVVTLSPFEGSTKNRYIPERDCVISMGSMQKPDTLRSGTTYLEHLSEIGLWKATMGKKPEDLIQTLQEMVMYEPWTCIFRESTAKGVGNYFHRQWILDKKGETNYTPVFISWFSESTNTLPVKDIAAFVQTFTEYDWFLWNEGATLEGINWYKNKLKDYGGDHWRMQSENPTTDIEAFQTTGSRVFSVQNVQKARQNNMPPIFIGDIIADAQKGKDAFKNIRFEPNPHGNLKIWAFPDTAKKIANRYVVPMDIGGRTAKADWSIIRVLDREPLLGGGVPEAILTYKAHIDHDLLAWKGAQIAYAYNKGLLVPESNSLDKESTEGDHTVTILNEIAESYDNLYCRTDPEKIKEGAPVKYGYHTNDKTKPALVSNINAAFRDEDYIEYDAEACDEADKYETKENGAYGAADGSNDDILMCTAIGLDVSNKIDRPYVIETKIMAKPRIPKRSEAVI